MNRIVYAKALICEKWDLPFYTPAVGLGKRPEGANSYQYVVSNRPNMVSAKALCTEWLLEWIKNSLGKKVKVVEFLGGVGITTTIIRGVLDKMVSKHVIYELDDQCLHQLRQAFPSCKVEKGDAKETTLRDCGDLVSLDFPYFTTKTLEEWAPNFGVLLGERPRAVLVTDTSAQRLPVHRAFYTKFFGKPIHTVEDYTKAFSNLLEEDYGYSISRAALRPGVSYYLLEPSDNISVAPEFRKFQGSKGKGFRWLGQ